MKETEIQKEKSRRTVRGEQSWCCTDAAFRRRHLGNIKRAVCIFRSFHTRIAWNLDLYISGTSGAKPHDPAEKICAAVSVQFCSGICIQRIIGCA